MKRLSVFNLQDGLYYATVQRTQCNAFDLKHFKDRYADQRWLIYDTLRKYGDYMTLNKLQKCK